MSDLACWRQGEGFVLRVHGSEHYLEAHELAEFSEAIELLIGRCITEWFGEDYRDLCIAEETAAAQPNKLLSMLGIAKPQPSNQSRFRR